MPDSCCKIYNVVCGILAAKNANIHKTSGESSVYRWAGDHEFPIMIIFLLISFLEAISYPIIGDYQHYKLVILPH